LCALQRVRFVRLLAVFCIHVVVAMASKMFNHLVFLVIGGAVVVSVFSKIITFVL